MLSLIKPRQPGKTLFFIFILLSSFLYANIINIPEDYGTIQDGINAATHGDTVLVQPGTYVENINYNGNCITVGSLFLTTQDMAYIGQTIIVGYSMESVVTFESGEDSTAVLCGFSITNGYASHGGGIYCNTSSPSLEYLKILNNSADYGGGVCCSSNSSPIISNSLIVQNTATICGGSIYCESNSNPEITNITSSDNITLGDGAIFIDNSYPIIKNSILWNGTAPEIYVTSGGISVDYTDVQGSWPSGTGNLDVDPNFLDNINYKLSILNPDGTAQNPCVDAGDPADPVGSEPMPNGDRINMGAYGGTSQAAFTAQIADPNILPGTTVYLPDYIYVFNSSPIIPSGGYLQIEPGAVIILNGSLSFEVYGQINIGAARSDSVFITSDIVAYGGSTNLTDSWQGFIFGAEALDGSMFNNVIIENAENGVNLGSVTASLDNTKITYEESDSRPSPGTGILIGDGSNTFITGSEISGYTIGIDIYNESTREQTTPVLTNNRVRNSPESSRENMYGIRLSGFVEAHIDSCEIEDYNYGIYYISNGTPCTDIPTLTNNTICSDTLYSGVDSLFIGIYLENLINIEIDSCEIYEYLTGIEIINNNSSRVLSTPVLTNNRVRNSPESSRQEAVGLKISGYVAATVNNCDIEDYDHGIQYIGTSDAFPVRETPVLTNNRVRNSPESSRTSLLNGIFIDSLATIIIDDCDIEDYKTAIEINNSNIGRETSTPVLTNNRVRNSPESSRDIFVGLRLFGNINGTVEYNEFVDCDSAIVIVGSDTEALIQYNLIYLTDVLVNSTAIYAYQTVGLTINDNTVYQYEYGLISDNAIISFFNNIFWNDNPIVEPVTINALYLTGSYNDISRPGGELYLGTGNINSSPMFVDVVAENFNIEWNSPCIDSGDPATPFDPDGTVNDIGLYYFNQPDYLESPAILLFNIDESSINLCWDLVSGAIGYNVYTSSNPYSGWSLYDFNVKALSWNEPVSGEKKFYYVKAYNSRSSDAHFESYNRKDYLNFK
ncbi:MAG: right-handed parallel beta-helix repeat-containing protein [Candidatus Cloacimonetes bacterium]|nr:right-handed parallel beta-helix repeat-containing protein [Candidatus Cloacimonadota bacterium]